MMTVHNFSIDFEDEFDDYVAKGRESVRVGGTINNVPIQEAGFGAGAAVLRAEVLFSPGHGGFVGRSDLVSRAVLADVTRVDPEDALAEAANLIELMGDEDDGATGAGNVPHLAQAFFLEIDVAYGENFVDEEDLRLEVGSDGEGQADVHSGRIMLHRRVDELFKLGEGDDFVELAADLALAHA